MLSKTAKLLCLLALGMGHIITVPNSLDPIPEQVRQPTAPLLPSYQNGDITLEVREEYQKAGGNHDWHITLNARPACVGLATLFFLLVGSAWYFGPE